LESQAGFEDLINEGDVIGFFKLVETVVQGVGTVSIYHLTTKFFSLRMTNGEQWASYFREWREVVAGLLKQGDPDKILDAILRTHLVTSVDQEYFKEMLTPIYATVNWPATNEIIDRLTAYATNKEVIANIQGGSDGTDGRIPAFSGRTRFSAGPKTCFNCGGIGHISANCPQPPSKCGVCGRRHATKFCPQAKESNFGNGRNNGGAHGKHGNTYGNNGNNGNTGNNGNNGNTSGNTSGNNGNNYGNNGNKHGNNGNMHGNTYGNSGYNKGGSNNRVKFDNQKKNTARTNQGNRFNSYAVRFGDEDAFGDQDNQDDEDNECEDDDEEFNCGIITVIDGNEAETSTSLKVNNISVDLRNHHDDIEFVMDTGCKRYNICTTKDIMVDLRPTNTNIVGISGAPMKADGVGLLPFAGETLLFPNADANLISVPQLLTMYPNTSIRITPAAMQLLKSDGDVLLSAPAKYGPGFWICTYGDLKRAAHHYATQTYVGYDPPNDSDEDQQDSDGEDAPFQALPVLPPLQPDPATPVPLPIQAQTVVHLSAEERSRAQDAWKLCALLGHPGQQKLIRDLENNCFPGTHLTGRDVSNALQLFGPCPACIEAKMRPPPEPTSLSPPAQSVGECLHGDILPLKNRSLGGHTCALAAVDEKTGFISFIPLPSKHTTVLLDAFKQIIAFYRGHGHVVKKIVTDAEANLKAMEPGLASLGVRYISLPPDMHEKRMERFVQTIKRRRDAMLATLSYELPTLLEAEALSQAVTLHNQTSNKASRPSTPLQLVTGQRPHIPQFYFGQVGLFYSKRRDNPHVRAEWGIFLGYNGHHKSLRAYIPLAQAVFSRRKFVPHHAVPPEWNLRPRLRPMTRTTPQRTASPGVPTQQIIADLPVLLPPPAPAMHPPAATITDPPPPPQPPPPVLPPQRPPPLIPTATQPTQAQEGVRISSPPPRFDDKKIKEIDKTTAPRGTEGAVKEGEPESAERRYPSRRAATNRGWIEGRHDSRHYKVSTTAHALDLFHKVYRVSFRAAMRMKDSVPGIMDAAKAEIDNMINNKVLHPVKMTYLKEGETPIPAHMFFNFKTKADGSFDKIKARIVANGDEQDVDTIGETYAPTVNIISVFLLISLVVTLGLHLTSHDIKAAFLLTPVKEDVRLFVVIRGDLANLWLDVHPEYAEFVTPRGEIVFRLLQYIYGLAESPHQFHEFLTKKLISSGYKPLRGDPCLLISDTPNHEGKYSYVAVHVDDMLHAASDTRAAKAFEHAMQEFCELSSQRDGHLSYLGLNIHHDSQRRVIHVDQAGYASTLLHRSGLQDRPVKKPPVTPSVADLVSDDPDPQPLTKQETKDYRSLVMAIMFLARMTRPDLLFTTTVLATHCNGPTQKNMCEVYRLLRYLQGTHQHGLIFRASKSGLSTPTIFADASHGLHPSGHGHGGIIIMLGEDSAPILTRSFKLPMITRSTAESELITLDEASAYAVWLRLMLFELKAYDETGTVPSVRIYQDNQSTIRMAQQETYNFKRSKHLLVRENYVRERIVFGDICLAYLPTDEMLADILTKPVDRTTLDKALARMSMSLG
jgi:hypothetical protein